MGKEWYHDNSKITHHLIIEGKESPENRYMMDLLLTNLVSDSFLQKKYKTLKKKMILLHINIYKKWRTWKGRRNYIRGRKKGNLYSSSYRFELDGLRVKYFSIREPRGIFKVDPFEYIPLYICPSCGHCHSKEEIPDIYPNEVPTIQTVTEYRKSHFLRLNQYWLTDRNKRKCFSCNKAFVAKMYQYYHKPGFVLRDQFRTIQRLDLWYKNYTKSNKSLFCKERGTQRTIKNNVFFYWDDFIAIQGLVNCPDNLLFEIVNCASRKELELMLNEKKKIVVFSSEVGTYKNGIYNIPELGSL